MAWWEYLSPITYGRKVKKDQRHTKHKTEKAKKAYEKQPFLKNEVPTMTGRQKKLFKEGVRQQRGVNYDIKKEQPYNQGVENINNILSGDPEALKRFEAPYLRQFNERTLPHIAQNFSMNNNQSGSAFQRALADSGVDFEERMAHMREDRKQNATNQALQYAQQPIQNAQSRYGQLQQYSPRQNIITQKPVPGHEGPSGTSQFMEKALPTVGTIAGLAATE